MQTSQHGKQPSFPPQEQAQQPGKQSQMVPQPDSEPRYAGSGKLKGKKALVTGGDSGIGRAVAQAMAREGADICIVYLDEDGDAKKARELVEKEGVKCTTIAGDIGNESFCREAVEHPVKTLGGRGVLVNNAAEQHVQENIENLDANQLERTFRTNFFGMVFMVKAALKHLSSGSVIINTDSVTAFKGNPKLLDYSATKGAIFTFTRSLAEQLGDKGIRVNCIAPGPIWTPLIPASYSAEHVQEFGKNTLMKRAGQ